jgi:translation initiation factor 1
MANDRNARLVFSTGAGRVAPAGEEPKAPESGRSGKGGIRLRLDRRASGRVVTLVSGLTGAAADVAALARELRASCGTGGTVRDDTIELQGDHRDKVEAELARRGLKSKRAGG